jgi:hypothetical protein
MSRRVADLLLVVVLAAGCTSTSPATPPTPTPAIGTAAPVNEQFAMQSCDVETPPVPGPTRSAPAITTPTTLSFASLPKAMPANLIPPDAVIYQGLAWWEYVVAPAGLVCSIDLPDIPYRGISVSPRRGAAGLQIGVSVSTSTNVSTGGEMTCPYIDAALEAWSQSSDPRFDPAICLRPARSQLFSTGVAGAYLAASVRPIRDDDSRSLIETDLYTFRGWDREHPDTGQFEEAVASCLLPLDESEFCVAALALFVASGAIPDMPVDRTAAAIQGLQEMIRRPLKWTEGQVSLEVSLSPVLRLERPATCAHDSGSTDAGQVFGEQFEKAGNETWDGFLASPWVGRDGPVLGRATLFLTRNGSAGDQSLTFIVDKDTLVGGNMTGDHNSGTRTFSGVAVLAGVDDPVNPVQPRARADVTINWVCSDKEVQPAAS